MQTIYTNKKGYGLSIAVFLADDEYDHAPVEGPYISVTELLKTDRMIVLGQRIKALKQDDKAIEEIDIDRFVPSAVGSAIHSAIEHSWTRMQGKIKAFFIGLSKLGYPTEIIERVRVNPTKEELELKPDIIPVYMEQRAYKKVGGFTLGGKYDFVGQGILEDFKTTQVYGYMKGDKDADYIKQGSMYRWLNPEIITSDIMKIQYIFTDWSKLDATIKAKAGYPENRIVEKQLKLDSYADTEAWIKEKINMIERYKDTPEPELPLCSQKDLWQDDPVYKYYAKPTLKRASKVFNNAAEAFDHCNKQGKGKVKEFGGKVKRCGYCNAFDICTQKDTYIAEGTLQMPA